MVVVDVVNGGGDDDDVTAAVARGVFLDQEYCRCQQHDSKWKRVCNNGDQCCC